MRQMQSMLHEQVYSQALFNKWLEYECDTRPRDTVIDLPYDSEKSRARAHSELEDKLTSNFTLGLTHGNMVAERMEEYHNWYQISGRDAVSSLTTALVIALKPP